MTSSMVSKIVDVDALNYPNDDSTSRKQHIASAFSRAAKSYDSHAELQKVVCDTLLDKVGSNDFERVVDLGCGTGYALNALSQRTGSPVIALDLSIGMLQWVKSQGQLANLLVADAEYLPLKPQSVDCIFSSLSVQWCDDIHQLMQSMYEVLKPGGLFYFSTLLDGTLHELQHAWKQVDNLQHVNHFRKPQDYQHAAELMGFDVVLDQKDIVCEYQTVKALSRDLKGIGAHYVSDNNSAMNKKGLMGKQKYQDMMSAYEAYRQDNQLLPATYKVLYGVLTKPSVIDSSVVNVEKDC